jgi:hypothetical protein
MPLETTGFPPNVYMAHFKTILLLQLRKLFGGGVKKNTPGTKKRFLGVIFRGALGYALSASSRDSYKLSLN